MYFIDVWLRSSARVLMLLCRENGYHIIPLPFKNQEEFGINFVSLGEGNLVCIHEDSAQLIRDDPVFHEQGGRCVLLSPLSLVAHLIFVCVTSLTSHLPPTFLVAALDVIVHVRHA